jgi:hypothetical protein
MAQQTIRQSLFNLLFKGAVRTARQQGYDECHRIRQAQIEGLINRLREYERTIDRQQEQLNGRTTRDALLAALGGSALDFLETGDESEFSDAAFNTAANYWYIRELEAEAQEREETRRARLHAARAQG